MNPEKRKTYGCGIVLAATVVGAAIGGLSLWYPMWSRPGGGGLIPLFPSGRTLALTIGCVGAAIGCALGAAVGWLMQMIVFYGRR